MKALLLRDARIHHKAGDIVEVSSAEFNFLQSVGSAVAYCEPKPAEEKPATKKTTKKGG